MVELRKAATLISTATTDANGNYIFSNAPSGPGSATSHKYGIMQLVPGMTYTVTVPITNGGNNLTTANVGEGSNTDLNDSDADTGTGVATVLATDIPVTGANNHTFDFGYAAPQVCSIIQINMPTCNDNGTGGISTDDYYDLEVTGTLSGGSGNYVVKIGAYTSPSTASGTAVTILGDGTHTNLAADGASTYTVRVEDAVDSNCFTEFESGPISACSGGFEILCGEGKRVDLYGVGNGSCNMNPDLTVNIPTKGNVYKNIVEVVYKDVDPGASITIQDNNGMNYTLPKVFTSAVNSYVYRLEIPGQFDFFTHDSEGGGCGVQSMVVYAFRNTNQPFAQAGSFENGSGYNDIQTFTIDITNLQDPATMMDRNMVVTMPITELTADGRYMKLTASKYLLKYIR